MIGPILKLIFGTKSDRDAKKLRPYVDKINEFEESYQKLSDDELKAKTPEFQERLKNGETLDDIMFEAFAVVKNACRRLMGSTIDVCETERTWDMIPYDVQLMGAIALHKGNIAEMQTGEGKTLVATMPLYLNALSGKNCQLVTVNDYLARRDAEWMGTIYKYLGLTVGCLQNDMPPDQRRDIYKCDITYGTNSEFGFDYLRDMGMAQDQEHMVQRDHFFAIIDEVDSILIDEARTPLIISGPVAVSTHQFDTLNPCVRDLYQKQNLLCSRYVKEAREVLSNPDSPKEDQEDAIIKLVQVRLGMPQHKQLTHALQDGAILKRVEKAEMSVRSDQNRGLLQEVQSDLYYAMDEKSHEADLTDKGRAEINPDDPEAFILPDMLTVLHEIDADDSLNDTEKREKKQQFQDDFAKKSEKLHNLSQLLKAYTLYEKDITYVVQDNKVMIVDEHTGRLMPGRRFSEGLHQALEAKENVKIEKETQTFATITIQNYFRMYDKLSGMTGTAETEASEFHQIYGMDVIVIPTNRPCQRKDYNDSIYKTKREKYAAIIDEVEECYERGQPVLLGTVSVDVSEVLSRMLKRRKISHSVLNAKNHQHEAEIVEKAGQAGSITVATNMAGRGTDIKLGDGVAESGGLHVIASERHDSRRIDRQLRGRCSRQGDPGSSRFYVSLEDNLMRLFGSDKIVNIMERFNMMDAGEEIQHPWLNRSIETAQKRVEQHHFSMRKRTLDYDDVMNKQREVVYGFRKEGLLTDNPQELLLDIVQEEIELRIESVVDPTGKSELAFNKEVLLNWLCSTFPLSFTESDLDVPLENGVPNIEELAKPLFEKVKKAYMAKAELEEPESLVWLERNIVLEAIDRLWQEHLYAMDHLRSSIGLRAYAQKDPLIEYKQEAFKMFSSLMEDINQEILTNMFKSATTLAAFEQVLQSMPQQLIHDEIGQFGMPAEAATATATGGEEGTPIEIEVPVTFIREAPKVGRNDPCPCGSGKKYKKCCGG